MPSEVEAATDGSTPARGDASTDMDGQVNVAEGDASESHLVGDASASNLTDGGDASLSSDAVLPCGKVLSSGDVLFDEGPPVETIAMASDRFVTTYGLQGLGSSRGIDWSLWDSQSLAMITRGHAQLNCSSQNPPLAPATLVKNLLVTIEACTNGGGAQLALRDARDGHVLATVNSQAYRYGIADDASYVWTAPGTQIAVYTPTGEPIASRDGGVSTAALQAAATQAVYAAPGKVRVARGPAGADVIEHISTTDGASTISPRFAGTFFGWFADGKRFLTRDGQAVRVYSTDVVSQKLRTLGALENLLGGVGEYYYTVTFGSVSNLNVYRVDGGDAPVLTVPAIDPGYAGHDPVILPAYVVGSRLLTATEQEIISIDLTGATPVQTSSPRPSPTLGALSLSPQGEPLSVSAGALFAQRKGTSAPSALTCGRATALDLADDGTWAVATSAGIIVVGKLSNRPVATAVAGSADAIEIADDGQHMLVKSFGAMSLYELPSLRFVRSEPTPDSYPPDYVQTWGFAQSGARVFSLDCSDRANCIYTLQDPAGTTTYASWTKPAAATSLMAQRVAVSPSGARVALGIGGQTYFYDNGTLSSVVSFTPYGWLTEELLLEGVYGMSGGGGLYVSTGPVVDATGLVRATPSAIAELDWIPAKSPLPRIDVLGSGTRFYARSAAYSQAGIRDATTGALLWQPTVAPTGAGAATDGYFLYPAGDQVRAVTHP